MDADRELLVRPLPGQRVHARGLRRRTTRAARRRPWLVAGVLGLLALPYAAAQEFADHVEFATDIQPIYIAAGDLNEDGRDDVLTVNDGTFWFPLQSGARLLSQEGGLGPPTTWPLPILNEVLIGDVTGNGHLDMVMVRWFTAATIDVWEGKGTGGFYAPTSWSDGIVVHWSVALGDMNGDGVLDIVTTGGGDVGLLLSNGDGTFTTSFLVQSSTNYQSIALGDFDGDGHLDVACRESPSGIDVFLGDGGGGLVMPPWSEEVATTEIAAADMDGDGNDDLVIRRAGGAPLEGWVQVLLSDGQGGFVLQLGTQLGVPGRYLAVGDFNGDGLPDVVVGRGSYLDPEDAVTVLTGDGFGRFAAASVLATGSYPNDVAVADIDGDGRLDILTANYADDSVSVLFNQTAPSPWTDLGYGLAGSNGIPVLAGAGTLVPGSAGSLVLTDANPNKLAVLFVGPVGAPAPFKGGALVPVPPLYTLTLGTDATGAIVLPWTSWYGGPPGLTWFFQYGVADAAGPAGASLSNALRALQP